MSNIFPGHSTRKENRIKKLLTILLMAKTVYQNWAELRKV